jgi:hypothetical protein
VRKMINSKFGKKASHVGIYHFIVVGKEPLSLHLFGLQKLGCSRVVLFVEDKGETHVERILKEFSTEYDRIIVEQDYMNVMEMASREASSAFNKGCTIAVNMSSGSRLIVEAVEDAVRLQQYYLMRHTSTVTVSAFRYFCDPSTRKLQYVPYWNTSDFLYTRFFEILVSKSNGLTLEQIHKEIVREMGEAAPNWEAFRKLFREFKRYLINLPFYSEGKTGKAKYSISLKD